MTTGLTRGMWHAQVASRVRKKSTSPEQAAGHGEAERGSDSLHLSLRLDRSLISRRSRERGLQIQSGMNRYRYGRVAKANQLSSVRELIHDAQSYSRRRRCRTCSSCRDLHPATSSNIDSIERPHSCLLSSTVGTGNPDPPRLTPQ